MKKKYTMLILLLSLAMGCTQKKVVKLNQVADGKYDSEFPAAPVSKAINRAVQSVFLVNSLHFYRGYDFDFDEKITIDDVKSGRFPGREDTPIIYERPSAGSATLIYNRNGKMAFLTCAHTVNADDTLITYYKIGENKTEYISTMLILVKQQINLVSVPGKEDVEILAVDKKKDIAVIGKQVSPDKAKGYFVFPYPVGNAKELDWGTLVYVIGYPYGKKMVSQALVSSPNYDWDHSFLIDATLYRGVSGAVVMALRDGPPHFELVGIARALSAETLYYLTPEDSYKKKALPVRREYEGKLYVEPHLKVAYGLTFTVSSEAIRDFFERNKDVFEDKGYFFDSEYFRSGNSHKPGF